MFCKNCGTQLPEYSTFCPNCGTMLSSTPAPKKGSSFSLNLNGKNRNVLMIAGVAVVAVALALILIFTLGGRSYEKTVAQYIESQFEGDIDGIIDLFPKKMMDEILDEAGYDEDEYDEFVREGEEALEEMLDYLEMYIGDDWELEYEIVDTETITGEELEDIIDYYADHDVKVKEAKTVEVYFVLTADGMDFDNTMDLSLIKIGNSWYLDLNTMGMIF